MYDKIENLLSEVSEIKEFKEYYSLPSAVLVALDRYENDLKIELRRQLRIASKGEFLPVLPQELQRYIERNRALVY